LGRKKKDESYSEAITFKITKEQKDVLDKNKWIKDEIKDYIRSYINMYIMK
jgi:hypothetical protein